MKLPKVSLTWKIIIGLVIGIFVGWLIGQLDRVSPDHHVFGIETATLLAFIRSLSTLFLNLIKTIIAPLIFATLVVGIAGTGDIKQMGRIGAKALIYFEIVTTLALFIGLAAVNLIRPGQGLKITGEVSAQIAQAHAPTFAEVLEHTFPTSIIDSMARGDVLQVVVFCFLFGAACASLGEKARPVVSFCESLSEVMFKYTAYVMYLAPFGVGAAIAVTIGKNGVGVMVNLGKLML